MPLAIGEKFYISSVWQTPTGAWWWVVKDPTDEFSAISGFRWSKNAAEQEAGKRLRKAYRRLAS